MPDIISLLSLGMICLHSLDRKGLRLHGYAQPP